MMLLELALDVSRSKLPAAVGGHDCSNNTI